MEQGQAGKIHVVTSRGHVLATYASLQDAVDKTGIDHYCISKVCQGRQRTTRGLIFRFASGSGSSDAFDTHTHTHTADNTSASSITAAATTVTSTTQAEDVALNLNPLPLNELLEALQAAIDRGEHSLIEAKTSGYKKKVQVMTSLGQVLAVYESELLAAKRTGSSEELVRQACSIESSGSSGSSSSSSSSSGSNSSENEGKDKEMGNDEVSTSTAAATAASENAFFVFRYAEHDAQLMQLSSKRLYEVMLEATRQKDALLMSSSESKKRKNRSSEEEEEEEEGEG